MNIKQALAAGTIVFTLLGTTVAYADSDNSGPGKGGVGISSFIGLHLGDRQDKDNNHGDDRKNDVDAHATTTVKENILQRLGDFTVGVVTSINGSDFTIKTLGRHATTTVTTNSSTTFAVNGQATTSNALGVGSRVFLTGSTTSTTTPTFAAAMVNIFTRGFGFFRHFFHH